MNRKHLTCKVRKRPVILTPEEVVRQALLCHMIDNLGYPLESLAVEKELSQMPHLSLDGVMLPQRRADIVCFAKGIHPDHPLYPLLLVECKSVKLSAKDKSQAIGYNRFLKSFYIAVANQKEIQTGWYDRSLNRYRYLDGLPGFLQLFSSLQKI